MYNAVCAKKQPETHCGMFLGGHYFSIIDELQINPMKIGNQKLFNKEDQMTSISSALLRVEGHEIPSIRGFFLKPATTGS